MCCLRRLIGLWNMDVCKKANQFSKQIQSENACKKYGLHVLWKEI